MKRFIAWMLAFVFVVGMIGCSALENAVKEADNYIQDLDEKIDDSKPVKEPEKEPAKEPEPAKEQDSSPDNEDEAYEVVYTKGTVYTNSIGTTWLQVVVQIENTGSVPLFLNSSSADIEDADGKLVKTLSYLSGYPQVLMPSETALLVEETTLDSNPGVDELTVIPHLDIEKAKVDCVRYSITDESLANEQYGGIKMLGRVENTTTEAKGLIYIVANLYDADHHGIGQMFTILTNELKPGEKIGFSMSTFSSPDSLTAESVASYEVFAFPSQFQF